MGGVLVRFYWGRTKKHKHINIILIPLAAGTIPHPTDGTEWRSYCGIQQKTAGFSQGWFLVCSKDASRLFQGQFLFVQKTVPPKMLMFIGFSCLIPPPPPFFCPPASLRAVTRERKMRTNFLSTNFWNAPRGPGHPGKIPGTSQIPLFETQGRQTFEPRGRAQGFLPPPLCVEDPHPPRRSPDPKKLIFVLFFLA